jgi:energy-converting hydrogenase Eha subunit B
VPIGFFTGAYVAALLLFVGLRLAACPDLFSENHFTTEKS